MKESPIKILIVDDEPLARRRIQAMLAHDAETQIVGECSDGREALGAIRRLSPDVVFLDIQMPEMDGLQLINSLENAGQPLFIFVTAYSRHGLAAFDAEAVDYLLKPFDQARFEKAVSQAKARLASARENDEQKNVLSLLSEFQQRAKYLKQIAVKTDGRIFLVKVEEINRVEAERNYVRLYAGAESYLRREAIGSLEPRLDPKDFRRIHRSTIVNLNYIKELQVSGGGDYRVILRSGESLTLSHTYQKNLREFLT